MKRSEAAVLIDNIRCVLARKDTNDATKRKAIEYYVRHAEDREGVKPLRECEGEAHSPEVAGNIDNCGVCAPRWGIAGQMIKVT